MSLITITEAAKLTRRDPRAVKKDADGLDSNPGPKNSRRYHSDDFLEAIYLGRVSREGKRVSYSDQMQRRAAAREEDTRLAPRSSARNGFQSTTCSQYTTKCSRASQASSRPMSIKDDA